MTRIADKALLVQLNISQWTARKYDRRATADVAHTNGVAIDVGRYNKNLLPVGNMLKDVAKLATRVRTAFYANTLPWGMEGTQLLPTDNFLAFRDRFQKDKDDWQQLVSRFVDAYPQLRADAETCLGPLYNAEDYPRPETIGRKFRMELAVYPLPTNDFRVQLADEELQRIQKDVEDRTEAASKAAMEALWKRLYDKVAHLADKLAAPDAVFRDTTVTGLEELLDLIPRLNVTNDQQLEALRQQAVAKLTAHEPDQLRHNPGVRKAASDAAADVLAKMGAFMGAA